VRVALMGRSLRPPLTGIGRYTLNLARALAAALSPGAVTLFLTRDAVALDGLPCVRALAPLPTPHELLRGAWEQLLVPLAVRRGQHDIYHSPNFTLPLSLPCPAVLTVHDLAYLRGGLHNARLQMYLRLLTSLAIARAARIIAVSQSTRRELEARYPRARGRVSVVYPGLDPQFWHPPAASAIRAFRERLGLSRPYLLFVGTIEPRKNLPRLVRAFEKAVQEASLPHELVVCGPWGWRHEAAARALARSPLRQRIRRLGYLPQEELPLLYAGAELLAYPSLLEGFGFPPLEAMALGTPVLTSDTSSLPEVVGTAAVTVSPLSVEGIAQGILRLLHDRSLADRLRSAGPERARQFTWERAARETLEAYFQARRES